MIPNNIQPSDEVIIEVGERKKEKKVEMKNLYFVINHRHNE